MTPQRSVSTDDALPPTRLRGAPGAGKEARSYGTALSSS